MKRQKKTPIVIAGILLGLATIVTIGAEVSSPSPSNQQLTPATNLPVSQEIRNYDDCIAAGGMQTPTLAPPAMCELHGKSYYDNSLPEIVKGSGDRQSCIDRANKSDARQEIIDDAITACNQYFR